MHDDLIICLVGESGSGKTTLAQSLEHDQIYNIIHSYTTRPPRTEGEWGHTFKTFENEEEAQAYLHHARETDQLIAYTYFGGHHYWAERHQYRGKGTSIYIIDPEGVKLIRQQVKDAKIVIIYLNTYPETRYCRLVEQYSPLYGMTEANDIAKQRIIRDAKMFTVIECDYCVPNNHDRIYAFNIVRDIINEERAKEGRRLK